MRLLVASLLLARGFRASRPDRTQVARKRLGDRGRDGAGADTSDFSERGIHSYTSEASDLPFDASKIDAGILSVAGKAAHSRHLQSGPRGCPTTTYIQCENGYEVGNPGVSCAEACMPDPSSGIPDPACCEGDRACANFTGALCQDGLTCMGNRSCCYANISYVITGCFGYESCYKAGYDGGEIKEVVEGCRGDSACRFAAAYGGYIEKIDYSCRDGAETCYKLAACNSTDQNCGSYVSKVVSSCSGGNEACFQAAFDGGVIDSIENGCNNVTACKGAGSGNDITISPGIVNCCNGAGQCEDIETTPSACSAATPTSSPTQGPSIPPTPFPSKGPSSSPTVPPSTPDDESLKGPLSITDSDIICSSNRPPLAGAFEGSVVVADKESNDESIKEPLSVSDDDDLCPTNCLSLAGAFEGSFCVAIKEPDGEPLPSALGWTNVTSDSCSVEIKISHGVSNEEPNCESDHCCTDSCALSVSDCCSIEIETSDGVSIKLAHRAWHITTFKESIYYVSDEESDGKSLTSALDCTHVVADSRAIEVETSDCVSVKEPLVVSDAGDHVASDNCALSIPNSCAVEIETANGVSIKLAHRAWHITTFKESIYYVSDEESDGKSFTGALDCTHVASDNCALSIADSCSVEIKTPDSVSLACTLSRTHVVSDYTALSIPDSCAIKIETSNGVSNEESYIANEESDGESVEAPLVISNSGDVCFTDRISF
ncbi:hypothetical protein ACHAXT_011371 [Thalassiosira profunda]